MGQHPSWQPQGRCKGQTETEKKGGERKLLGKKRNYFGRYVNICFFVPVLRERDQGRVSSCRCLFLPGCVGGEKARPTDSLIGLTQKTSRWSIKNVTGTV